MNSITFLISTLFDLYIMVVILRVWLQAARADFYNPFSQFIVKATQPVVGPMRRLIPSIGSIDLATVLFAYILCVGKLVALYLIVSKGAVIFQPDFLIVGAISLLKAAGKLLFWVLIIRAILSWVSQGGSPIEYVFQQLTEPMLAPVRRVIPPMGGIDLSMIVVFIALQFANILVGDVIGLIWGDVIRSYW